MNTGWRIFTSEKYNKKYYYNIFTNSKSWTTNNIIIDRPENNVYGWKKIRSNTYNQEYWFNQNTGKTTWEYPLKPCRNLIQYTIINNDGGGDCLFKSFRDIRNFYGQEPSYTHQELRELSCNWLASDDFSTNAQNGTEQRARLDVLESLQLSLFPPEGIEVTLPEVLSRIKQTRKRFNKKYNLPEDTPIDMSNSQESIGELGKRYAYVLSKVGEYGNTPDITALSWVLGVKTCVYKDAPDNSTGSSFGPAYKAGPTYYIIAYGDAHFEGMKDVVENN
jgi:hypothetical protein